MIAARAEKRGFPPGVFEKRMIAAIIEHPEPKKERRNKEAVNDGGSSNIHDGPLAEENASGRENRRRHVFTMKQVHIE